MTMSEYLVMTFFTGAMVLVIVGNRNVNLVIEVKEMGSSNRTVFSKNGFLKILHFLLTNKVKSPIIYIL